MLNKYGEKLRNQGSDWFIINSLMYHYYLGWSTSLWRCMVHFPFLTLKFKSHVGNHLHIFVIFQVSCKIIPNTSLQNSGYLKSKKKKHFIPCGFLSHIPSKVDQVFSHQVCCYQSCICPSFPLWLKRQSDVLLHASHKSYQQPSINLWPENWTYRWLLHVILDLSLRKVTYF